LNQLFIWVDDEKIATLSHDEGSFELSYETSWIASGGYPISPHLPLGEISRDTTVKNFFSNLLPEGKPLDGLSQQNQVKQHDVFGLLKKVGRDCAGALVITDTDEPTPDSRDYERSNYLQISHEELNQQIVESRQADVPLMLWGRKPRMSLAGVQNKMGLYVDSEERLWLPTQSQPTSHILKIGATKYPGMAVNEYFCMQLGQALDLGLPDTQFRRLPEPVLLVHRYDREWTDDAGTMKRRHQIDACQALNLPPDLKYEQEYEYSLEGATLADIVDLAKICDTPSAAQETIINWILFNYLIGNTDAHAKNLSFLINRASHTAQMLGRNASIRVAPFYDLVSGSVYDLNNFAQHIGNEDDLRLVSARDWREFAKQTGVVPKLVKKLGEMLIKKMTNKLDQVAGRVSAETSDEIVGKIRGHIRAQTNLLKDSLIGL
jgi:serine/threonine-protein kinase HipA